MSEPSRGRVIRLSSGRKIVTEILHHAWKVPSLPLERECRIPGLVDARRACATPPSWMAIFMKAYALLSREHPVLRHAYLTFPYHRIYEHSQTECSLIVEREWQGELIVLMGKIVGIENKTLAELDENINHYRSEEVWKVSNFRQLLRMARTPKWIRRFEFWRLLNWNGARRARRAGTFSISSLGMYEVEQSHPRSPLTTYFTFGPIQPDGRVTLKIIYDHRVMDGGTVARMLVDLEDILNTRILSELHSSAQSHVSRRAG